MSSFDPDVLPSVAWSELRDTSWPVPLRRTAPASTG